MTAATGPVSSGPRPALFAHALRLHRQVPDGPLPRDGEPYPDDDLHRRRPRPRARDPRLSGAEAAAILDRHLHTEREPSALADAFHDVEVPIHRNDHIAAAALRADRERVRSTGRWLVRHSTDRCGVLIGLALLAADWNEDDVPLIQTMGLLSDKFAALAVEALRRRQGREQTLLWLGRRVGGWGKVYVVQALCEVGTTASRDWLLRESCDRDYLSGYIAGGVATSAHLHEAIVRAQVDDALVQHTGRLLAAMASASGMGPTLADYPPASIVLAAHAAHLARRSPNPDSYVDVAQIVDELVHRRPQECRCTEEQRDRIVAQYRVVLDRPDWLYAVGQALRREPRSFAWFLEGPAA